ncbi:site-specific integrase [Hahella aquimaris]|uniref:site-specific integrase n=1 Tax=Hahella sp. HNIBRBA332 TaxID=3015983 RepID=UPI00273BCDED|nr:site-specific integrase [Hahella sp. HNIBRBA332]WLQ15384.1 site-specific integrase [Hahella sp. HNIBRBA332]
MATIIKRKAKDGSTRYRVQIRVKKGGEVVHSESATFPTIKLAKEYERRRETELDQPGAIERMQYSGLTVRDVLQWYFDEYHEVSGFGESKMYHIKMMLNMEPLASTELVTLSTAHLVDHLKNRRKTVSASTANNDLVWLRVAFRTAKSHFPSYPISLQVIDDAAVIARKHKLVAKSAQRDRRPTAEELALLSDYFIRRDQGSSIPMHDIMWFAIHSARRQGEIVKLKWSDNNEEVQVGLVRDAKHPTKKVGNHRKFKYTNEAWEIIQRQPRNSEYIFPYYEKTISTAFTKACQLNGIEDLRFHDLRHEATSRLFEAGYSIVEVQQFTLHESWGVLKRYTNLRPENLELRA